MQNVRVVISETVYSRCTLKLARLLGIEDTSVGGTHTAVKGVVALRPFVRLNFDGKMPISFDPHTVAGDAVRVACLLGISVQHSMHMVKATLGDWSATEDVDHRDFVSSAPYCKVVMSVAEMYLDAAYGINDTGCGVNRREL